LYHYFFFQTNSATAIRNGDLNFDLQFDRAGKISGFCMEERVMALQDK
jgi:hypothetical protein